MNRRSFVWAGGGAAWGAVGCDECHVGARQCLQCGAFSTQHCHFRLWIQLPPFRSTRLATHSTECTRSSRGLTLTCTCMHGRDGAAAIAPEGRHSQTRLRTGCLRSGRSLDTAPLGAITLHVVFLASPARCDRLHCTASSALDLFCPGSHCHL